MNREQWQQKRSHAETTGIPPAFGTAKFVSLIHATEMPGSSDPASVAVRKQQYYDAIACCEWAIVAPGPEDLPALPIYPE